MAFTEVGAGSQRATKFVAASDSTTLAFPANVVANNLLVVAGSAFAATQPTSIVVSDSLSSSYTVLYASGTRAFIAYALAASSGACTVTVNPQGTSADFSFSIDEFNANNAISLDVDGGVSSGTSTTPADDILTVTANDLLIGIMNHDSVDQILTPGTNYTQIGESEDNTGQEAHNAEFRIVTTATTYTVDWTVGASVAWNARTAAFKEAAGGATWGPLLGGFNNRLVVNAD